MKACFEHSDCDRKQICLDGVCEKYDSDKGKKYFQTEFEYRTPVFKPKKKPSTNRTYHRKTPPIQKRRTKRTSSKERFKRAVKVGGQLGYKGAQLGYQGAKYLYQKAKDYKHSRDRDNEIARLEKVRRSILPWTKEQGQNGFVEYARSRLEITLETGGFQCGTLKPQLYQSILSTVTKPYSSVKRLGVSWPTGAGKTLGIILVLDNWYDMAKGKVVIFPSESIVKEFLRDLMKFENRWSDFVQRQTGGTHIEKGGDAINFDLVQKVISLTGLLKNAGDPGFPAGPLRIFSYGRAGGSQAFSSSSQNAVFRFNKKHIKELNQNNPYDSMQVIMDEAHNLLRAGPDMQNELTRIKTLADALYSAVNTEVIAFTATWANSTIQEYRDLLSIVKGVKYKDVPDKGFLLYYNDHPPELFAKTQPKDPSKILPPITYVPMSEPQTKIYLKKFKQGLSLSKLASYANIDTYYGSIGTNKMDTMIENIDRHSPKIGKLIQYLKQHPDSKILVICHRKNGLKLMVRALQHANICSSQKPSCLQHLYDATSKDKKALDEWNKLDRGIMIADEKFYSTGVSFLKVREMVLFDVPESATLYLQIVGRALRLCGHSSLPKSQRKLDYTIMVSTMPDGVTPTAEGLLLIAIKNGLENLTSIQNEIRKDAIDSEHMYTSSSSFFSGLFKKIADRIF